MEIKVVGSGCDKCDKLYDSIEKLASNYGLNVNIIKVEDLIEIVTLGIMSTPALVIDGKVVHKGSVPDEKKLMKYLGIK